MSLQPEQPFHEIEQRYILAEILKTSSIAPTDLLKLIQEHHVAPQWEHIALPNGRSVASCKSQFDMLTKRGFPGLGASSQASPAAKSKKKRAASGVAPTAAMSTPPQPQQYQFAPINEPSSTVPFQAVPFPAGETPERQGKKRGRPSKAERELREAEAAARGEVYQPMKRKPKAPKPAMPGAEGDEAPKPPPKKSKKQEVSVKSPELPTQPQLQLGQPSHPSPFASQSLLGMQDQRMRPSMPESQPPTFTPSQSLVSGVRDQSVRPDMSMLHSASQFGTPQGGLNLRPDLTPRGQPFTLSGRPSSGERGMQAAEPTDDRLREYSAAHGHSQSPFGPPGFHPK